MQSGNTFLSAYVLLLFHGGNKHFLVSGNYFTFQNDAINQLLDASFSNEYLFFSWLLGTHRASNFNSSITEKRSAGSSSTCRRASYRSVTLHDYVYRYNCFPGGWGSFLEDRDVNRAIRAVSEGLSSDSRHYDIEPEMPMIFNAFNVGGYRNVRVIILGQDPTAQPGQATGYAFSLWPNVEPYQVPTVFNVLVELKWEGYNVGLTNGDLTSWVPQGVFLLNAALTVRERSPGSHQRLWRNFISLVIRYIHAKAAGSAWLLWGREASNYASLIDTDKRYIKTGGHPSPRSTEPFFGRNYFKCANDFLRSEERSTVDWGIPVNQNSIARRWKRCDYSGL